MTKDYHLDVGNEEEKLGKLVKTINKGKFKQAKKFADVLLEEGVLKTTINYRCYDLFHEIKRKNYGKGIKLARIFEEDYHWKSWLDN